MIVIRDAGRQECRSDHDHRWQDKPPTIVLMFQIFFEIWDLFSQMR